MNADMPQAIEFAAGLYWRQSMLNGRKCVPAILELTQGRVRLLDASGEVFAVPCAEVSGRVTGLSTLILEAGGRSYDLVGKPSNISPKFTPEMLDYVRARSAQVPSGTLVAMGVGLNALGASPLGALAFAFDFAEMTANIAPWKTLLPAAGVRMR